MTTRVLPKTEWQAYFDRVSRGLTGRTAHVEVASLALGDQSETRWLPLFGLTYDPKGDLMEIAMEGLDHLIARPRQVSVEEGPSGLASMEVIDGEERRQIVRLGQPLALPAP